MRKNLLISVLAVGAGFALFGNCAWADPLPGEFLKFRQLPLNLGLAPSIGGAPFPGHDERSSAYPSIVTPGGIVTEWRGTFMADDFADKLSSPVVHLRWWGSYEDNYTANGDFAASKFLISFEKDIPASTAVPFSHPGDPLLNQIVFRGPLAPASGTFIEKPIFSDGAPEQLYEYNAELRVPFAEQRDTVYWLKIVALLDSPNVRWGWHNRDYAIPDPFASVAVVPGEFNAAPIGAPPIWHFQDDAVTGGVIITADPSDPLTARPEQFGMGPTHYIPPLDGPPEIGSFSKDLAFELYTVPEPGVIGLVAIGMVSLGVRRRK